MTTASIDGNGTTGNHANGTNGLAMAAADGPLDVIETEMTPEEGAIVDHQIQGELDSIVAEIVKAAPSLPSKESRAIGEFIQSVGRPPQSEEDMLGMTIEALGRDPERVRAAGQEAAAKFEEMAKAIEARLPKETASLHTQPTIEAPQQAQPAQSAATTAPPNTPPTAFKPIPHVRPMGYLPLPEGTYRWAPDMWGGLPLHGIPLKYVKVPGHPTLIYFFVTEPCYARNRAGRVVKLPPGSRVVVNATIAWAPVLPAMDGPKGRPALYIVPTTRDTSGPMPIIRPAAKDEPLYRYETGDGGYEYGMEISYDPDPDDPKMPRLISMETIQGGVEAAGGGGGQ